MVQANAIFSDILSGRMEPEFTCHNYDHNVDRYVYTFVQISAGYLDKDVGKTSFISQHDNGKLVAYIILIVNILKHNLSELIVQLFNCL